MKLLFGRVAGLVSLLVAGLGAAHAEEVSATFIPPLFQIGTTDLTGSTVTENADGSFTMAGQQSGNVGTDRGWALDWNVRVDYDPSIIGSFTLTNLGSTTRNFTLLLDLPVAPFSPSLYGGSITATVFDDNGDSIATLATSTVTGASPGIYAGTIDGSPVLDLFDVGATCTGGPHCSGGGGDQDGLPGPTIPGPGVSGHIGTVLMFSLTAHDRVVFNTNFTVSPAPIPLPASSWMLLGALGCMGYFFTTRGNRDRKMPIACV